MDIIKCPQCGSEIQKAEKVCTYCGNIIVNPTQNNIVSSEDRSAFSNNNNSIFVFNEEKPKKKFVHGFIIGGIIGVAIGGVSGIIIANSVSNATPDAIVTNSDNSEKMSQKNDVLSSKNKSDVKLNLEDETTDVIIVSKKNLKPYIYNENEMAISIDQCNYQGGNAQIVLSIENDSLHDLYIEMNEIVVDDANIRTLQNTSPVYPGAKLLSYYTLLAEDLRKAEVDDFETISFIIRMEDENQDEIVSQPILINKDAFS